MRASSRRLWSVVRWQLHRCADVGATFFAIAVAEIGLRVLGLRRTARAMRVQLGGDDKTVVDARSPELPLWAHRRLRTVDQAMRRWPFGDTCLRRALVSARRLRRLDPVVMVGVRLVDGELDAHAWINIEGCDLDPLAGSYAVLDVDLSR